ncbi:MAG: MazG domain protein [Candidatus Saccharibacteria bacterium]|nr:MazG domain protein [Candidatus Saccharibacteria bacterium]
MAFGSVIRCTLSGSFRRDQAGIKRAYHELVTCGCQVLSPHRLEFDAPDTLFVKDSAERDMSDADIEAHHLQAIKQSDFVWVHLPDGYMGLSAACEIGYATALGLPVFSDQTPSEPVFQSLVTTVPSVFRALELLNQNSS